MKKLKLMSISLCCLMLLSVTGCNSQSSSQKTTQPPVSQRKDNTSKNENSGKSQIKNTNSSSNSNSSSKINSNSSSNSNQQTVSTTDQEVLNNVSKSVKTRVPLVLPKQIPLTDGKYLTAATTSETWYYEVQYYETEQPVGIDSPSAAKGTSLVKVEGTEYKSSTEAYNQLSPSYYKVEPAQEQAIDLGNGIQAQGEGTMGHSYISWNEGRWFLVIDSPNDPEYQNNKYKDNQELAAKVVTYLNENALPAPHQIGVINISTWENTTETTIQWQFNQMIYQVTAQDPFVALNTAVAMQFVEQPKETFTYLKEGTKITTTGHLYNSHAQPIRFYVFEDYSPKQGGDIDEIAFSLDDRSYMTIQVIDDMPSKLSEHKQWDDVTYKGLEDSKVFADNTKTSSTTEILIPAKNQRPALKVVVHSPTEVDNIVDYYEMIKTIQ